MLGQNILPVLYIVGVPSKGVTFQELLLCLRGHEPFNLPLTATFILSSIIREAVWGDDIIGEGTWLGQHIC